MGYSPWGRKELDKTERFHFYFLSGSYALPQGAGMGEGVKKGSTAISEPHGLKVGRVMLPE